MKQNIIKCKSYIFLKTTREHEELQFFPSFLISRVKREMECEMKQEIWNGK